MGLAGPGSPGGSCLALAALALLLPPGAGPGVAAAPAALSSAEIDQVMKSSRPLSLHGEPGPRAGPSWSAHDEITDESDFLLARQMLVESENLQMPQREEGPNILKEKTPKAPKRPKGSKKDKQKEKQPKKKPPKGPTNGPRKIKEKHPETVVGEKEPEAPATRPGKGPKGPRPPAPGAKAPPVLSPAVAATAVLQAG